MSVSTHETVGNTEIVLNTEDTAQWLNGLAELYPPQPFQTVPRLPEYNAVATMSLTRLMELLYEYTAYMAHLATQSAIAKATHKDCLRVLQRTQYSTRKALREQGFGRDELKEEVETSPLVAQLQEKADHAESAADYMSAQVKAVGQIQEMLQQLVYIHARRQKAENALRSLGGEE